MGLSERMGIYVVALSLFGDDGERQPVADLRVYATELHLSKACAVGKY